jgi:hypothetical protein
VCRYCYLIGYIFFFLYSPFIMDFGRNSSGGFRDFFLLGVSPYMQNSLDEVSDDILDLEIRYMSVCLKLRVHRPFCAINLKSG